MTKFLKHDIDLDDVQEYPYWDNQSCLEYCRRHARLTVDEFCQRLLEECEKVEQEQREQALKHANDSL